MTDPPPPSAPAPSAADPPPTPELVFREYAPRIYHIARRMLGNEADAEDVTQDVLLQVIRKLDTFRGDAQLATWLHRVTVNAALAYRQKRTTRQKRETTDTAEDVLETAPVGGPVKRWNVGPDEPVLAAEQAAVIERAIGDLPSLFRDVYVLADVEGLPNAEIADMLGLSVAAVKSRLHRARTQMRDALSPHFEGVGAVKLTCSEFRDLLGDHLGGDLVVEVKESFDLHLGECDHCGYYLESYTHTVKVTRKLPKCGPLPPAVEARLREVLKEHLGGPK